MTPILPNMVLVGIGQRITTTQQGKDKPMDYGHFSGQHYCKLTKLETGKEVWLGPSGQLFENPRGLCEAGVMWALKAYTDKYKDAGYYLELSTGCC